MIQRGVFPAQKEIRAEMELYIMTVIIFWHWPEQFKNLRNLSENMKQYNTFAMLFAFRHSEKFWLNFRSQINHFALQGPNCNCFR